MTLRQSIVALVFLAGAAQATPRGVSPTEIVIGQSAPLTGPAQGLGLGIQLGLKAAIDEANAKGGVHGRKIRLVSMDDGYEPEKTVDRTVQLIEQDKVFALAGYVGTPTSKVALPIAEENKTPLVGIFSGAMLLRQPVQRYAINIRASYDDETEALVEALGPAAAKLSVFYQDDSFGLAGLTGIEKALARRKLAVVSKGSFERNTLAVKSGVARVLEGKPDAVAIIAPYKPTAAFVREARAAGLGAKMVTISFVGTENLIQELGPAADGMMISQVVPSPDDDSLPLVQGYGKALPAGTPRSYVSLEGYVNGRTLVAALEAAGKEPTQESLVDAIEAMKSFDLGGLLLSFAKDNHQGSKSVFLSVVTNGKAKPVPAAHASR